ncbi:MAG: multidrug DMT transporter permease [Gallionellales bacterium GWE2_58_10]|nr:MAG: multidrug DMT transporter permease [Gallionellales bacterium GWE2_58_10]
MMPIAGVLSGALVWGLIWYPYRVLQDAGVSGALATLITYLLAMLCGAFMLPRVWRELPKAGWWAVALLLSAGWTNFGYVLAVLHGEVMRVLLLFYLAPLWTILFSYWLLDERLNRYGYFVIALSFSGAFIMLWKPQLGLPLPDNFAEWIGLSAGMGFALSNVVSRRAAHLGLWTKSYSVWLGTAILTAPLLWWQGGLPGQLLAIDAQGWLILVLLGAVICGTSFAVQYALAHLPANRAIILFLFELVIAAASSYLLVGEAMQLRDWIGALLIVSASLLSGRLHADTVK